MQLAAQGQEIQNTDEYRHDPTLKNNYGYTVALLQARNGKEPQKQWYHDKFIRAQLYINLETEESSFQNEDDHDDKDDQQLFTVQNFLIYNGFELNKIPKEWRYQVANQKTDNTIQMIHAYRCEINQLQQPSGNILQTNKKGQTVAMILAQKDIIPPKCWLHDDTIVDVNNKTLSIYFTDNQLPYFNYHDIINNKESIFTQAMFRQIPDINGHQPDEQDDYDFTVAMILAINKLQIPKEWIHNSLLSNIYGYTVALLQASRGTIPDSNWNHNKFLRVKYYNQISGNPLYYTVQNFLKENGRHVPDSWRYDNIIDRDDNTKAMELALQGIIPAQQYYHDPLQTNKYNNTVAIILADKGIIPPRQWMHDINLQNASGDSIKSLLKFKGIPVPYHWHDDDMTIFDQACFDIIPDIAGHNPYEQNQDGLTVAMIYLCNNRIPPNEWMYDIDLQINNISLRQLFMCKNLEIPLEFNQQDQNNI